MKPGAWLKEFDHAPALNGLSGFAFRHCFGFGRAPNLLRTLARLAAAIAEDFAFLGAFITSAHCVALL
jgi:hypothetical protein